MMPGTAKSTGSESVNYDELESLMRDYPEWREQYPEIAQEIYPHRFLKNKSNMPKYEGKGTKRSSTVVPHTDYQDTYLHHSIRPRSTKRPPPSPRDPHPPRMMLETTQQAEFPAKFSLSEGRPPAFKHEVYYEPPSERFEDRTAYKLDYPPKKPEDHVISSRHVTQLQKSKMPTGSGTFDSRTTNKEFYRQWPLQTNLTFRELPSFTNSVLYPSQQRHLETTNGRTFMGKQGVRPEPVVHPEGNIPIQGDLDFSTTNALTYKRYEGHHRPDKIVHVPELMPQRRSKFHDDTQFKRDFGKHPLGFQPPKPIAPPPATVDLAFDNRRSFMTEQKKEFQGIDVSKHAVMRSYKPEGDEYKIPDVKFETQTKHMLDFQPIDIPSTYTEHAKPPQAKQDSIKSKFGGPTTTQDFFRAWPVQSRRQYADAHEAMQFLRRDLYIPNQNKFEGTTTTGDTFGPKSMDRVKPYIPEETVVDRGGEIDLNTVYRVTFHGTQLARNLNKKQAAQLLKELRKRKAIRNLHDGAARVEPVSAK